MASPLETPCPLGFLGGGRVASDVCGCPAPLSELEEIEDSHPTLHRAHTH